VQCNDLGPPESIKNNTVAPFACAAIEPPAYCIAARGPWAVDRAPFRKGPRARFPPRNPQKSAKNRESRPTGGTAAAPALFRVNNYMKNDMA